MKIVNGRPVPDTLGELQSPQGLDAMTGLLTECANVLAASESTDGLALDGDLAVGGNAVITGTTTSTSTLIATAAATVGTTLTVTGEQITASGVGAKNGATVTAVEYGNGAIHKTVLTLAATPVTIADGGGGHQGVGGVKVYDFPAGAILFFGATANLALLAGAGGIADTFDGDFGVGTVVGTGDDLTTTMQNIIPKTATPQAAAGATTAKGQSTATENAVIDGTSTAADAFLNFLIDDADISEGDTIAATGTITILWANLGDY